MPMPIDGTNVTAELHFYFLVHKYDKSLFNIDIRCTYFSYEILSEMLSTCI